jgi:hypothetical protein
MGDDRALRPRRAVAVLLLGALALLGAGVAAAGSDSERSVGGERGVLVVLDGSAGMAEMLDGTPKIDLAKAAIADLIQNGKAGHPLGFAATGHRAERTCRDFELRLEIGDLARSSLVASVDAVQPLGRRDLDHVLTAGAEALGFRERPATLVLIAGGASDCVSVPLSLARELRAEGHDFRVHVIGLGVDARAEETLSGIARNTGGRHYTPSTVPELVAALREAIAPRDLPMLVADARGEAPAAPSPAPAETEDTAAERRDGNDEAAAAAESEPTGVRRTSSGVPIPMPHPRRRDDAKPEDIAAAEPPAARDRSERAAALVAGSGSMAGYEPLVMTGLRLAGVAAPGGPTVGTDLFWEVFAAGEDGSQVPVARSWDPAPVFILPEGAYTVTVQHGEVRRTETVQIDHVGLHRHEVVLDAAYLRLASVAVDGSDPLESDLLYRVVALDGAIAGEPVARAPLVESRNARPLLKLPPGRYEVSVQHGPVEARRVVELAAGALQQQVFDLDIGYLRLNSVAREGGDPLAGDVSFAVETMPSAPGEAPVLLATSNQPTPLFKLPAGRHMVTARRGVATAQIVVDVAAGTLAEATVNLQIGYLRVVSRLGDFPEPLGDGVTYRIAARPAGAGAPAPLTDSRDPAARFTLSAGNYVVIAELGDKRTETEIALRPGEVQEVMLTFDGLER